MLCPFGLTNNPNCSLKTISYVTIHNTGNYNPTANALHHAQYQRNGSNGRTASWHYSVDAQDIWQSFDDKRQCWHTGTAPGNAESIGIEICVNDYDDFRQACDNAAWLTAELLQRYDISMERVVQHNFWSGKDCPHELRSGVWDVNWSDFITAVEGHTDAMSVKQISPDLLTAIMLLHQEGIILSPEYWIANVRKLKHIERLLFNMANYVVNDKTTG
jgi:N-acetylmuramoyl-L-alanine amidase CwlA